MGLTVPKVTFILGLCGSGKTYWSKRLKEKTGAEVFEDLLHNNACPALIQRLKDGKDCIVEEFKYCIPKHRDEIAQDLSEVPDLQVEWFCLENDIESANWNVIHRKDKGDAQGHIRINQSLHFHYVYPEGAKIIPITRIGPPSA